MKKGITPIIAIIILLLITIALAGAAWAYLQGFLFSQIANSFRVPEGNGVYCTGANTETGTINVLVVNTGYQSILTASDFATVDIDGIELMSSPLDPAINTGLSLTEGDTGKLVNQYDCGGVSPLGACDAGPHTVILGTGASVLTFKVNCP
jgi:flagellin-like protein